MKELCPTGDSIDVVSVKAFTVDGDDYSIGTAIDTLTSTINSTTVALTLNAAINGMAPAGAAVSQLNTGATGELAAPATATDTVIFVTVLSGTFDNSASNTLTVGSISGAKVPDASTPPVIDEFGLPALASCETLYTDFVTVVLTSTVGTTAAVGEAVTQASSGATGTIAVARVTGDNLVYVTVTSGTFDATGDIVIDAGSALSVSDILEDLSTEPVSFTRGTSTSTPYEVTGVYTPTSGQVRTSTRVHLSWSSWVFTDSCLLPVQRCFRCEILIPCTES
eukprot:SAG31_NODE_185_length_20953_cov_17.235398_9_plen_280_part_00